jgi:nucleotide-binding universal stress UspA family protein
MFKGILIPTDGSELSERAIKQGVSLAKALGATVVGLTVTEPFHVFAMEPMMVTDTAEKYEEDLRILTKKYLSVVEAVAKQAGVPCRTLTRSGEHPYEEIIKAAETQRCDAICMASHGRRGLSALVLGSETVKVLTHSRIPVVVVR